MRLMARELGGLGLGTRRDGYPVQALPSTDGTLTNEHPLDRLGGVTSASAAGPRDPPRANGALGSPSCATRSLPHSGFGMQPPVSRATARAAPQGAAQQDAELAGFPSPLASDPSQHGTLLAGPAAYGTGSRRPYGR